MPVNFHILLERLTIMGDRDEEVGDTVVEEEVEESR
jgi:hypothetical protein